MPRYKHPSDNQCCYSDARSRFVRKKIVEAPARKRRYIDDLLELEYYILNGSNCLGGAYLYHGLRNKYGREHKAICLELKPKEYRENQKREARERAKELEEDRRLEAEERALWKAQDADWKARKKENKRLI